MPEKTALLLGATGLVGAELLTRLRAEPFYDRIVVFTRRPLSDLDDDPKVEARVIDFDDPDSYLTYLDGIDHVYCALGTTNKKTPDKTAYRKVDVVYPYELAEAAQVHGAEHYLLVSALGADPDSRVFYNRIKGELELMLRDLRFRSLTIAHPSLLLGERDEFRLGEAIMKRLSFLFPPKYKPIHARTVAAALVAAGTADEPGVHVLSSRTMREQFG